MSSPLFDGRRAIVLAAVLLSTLTFPLSITGASLALPDIRSALGADLAAVQWVINAYNACFAAFLVVTGALADVLGRRRVFACGVGLFFLSGVLCAFAGDVAVLAGLRAAGGVGAAAAVTGGSSLLAETFSGAARKRAFGLLGTVLGVGTAFGPAVAGTLVELLGWRGVFAAPAVVAGLVLVLVPLLPAARAEAGRRVDGAGAVLFTVALLLVVTALVEGPERGFGSPVVVGAAVVAVVLGVVLVRVERRREAPLFDLGVLANRRFLAFAVAAGAIMAVLVPLLVYLPSYLITVVGVEASAAGWWLLPMTLPTVLLPSVGAEVAKRVPAVPLVAGAVAVCGAGAALLLVVDGDASPWRVVVPFVLVGVGAGVTNGLLDGLAIGSVAEDRAGTASGMFNTVRITGETVAIAVVGAVLAAVTGGGLAGPAYTGALHVVGAGLGVFALVVAVGVVALARGRVRVPSER
ncbi:MFS transporter [Nocardiopsis trehalosi]|uniref:MFS transporter n=1 Tax=Nocardiopsis trehalosi TaxID=109329 RepID=UPI000A989C5C|nr:MFS transporter [Nocardiopsis trehalosi]